MKINDENIFSEFRPKIQAKANKIFAQYFPNIFRPDLINDFIDQSFTILFNKIKNEEIFLEEDGGLKVIIPSNNRTYSLENYLLGICRNSISNYRRKHQKDIHLDLNEVDFNIPTELIYQPEIEKELFIKEFWQLLNYEEKFIFELKLFGYSYREIAEKFNSQFDKNYTDANLRKIFERKIRQTAKDFFGLKS